MLQRISEAIARISHGWVAIAALVIFVAFSVLVLPRQSATAGEVAGVAGSPDMSFWYSPGDLYRMAEAYGARGRETYIRGRFTFDVVWPLVYTLFLATALSWLTGRAFAPTSWWQRANLAPILGALFDYLENMSTSAVMWRYPDHTMVVDVLAPVFTSLKWVFVGGSFVLLLGSILVAIWRWGQGRRSS